MTATVVLVLAAAATSFAAYLYAWFRYYQICKQDKEQDG